jgi:hypothetical protein
MCYHCRKEAEAEKLADSKQVVVHGVTIRPSYMGARGNIAKTVQGWGIIGTLGGESGVSYNFRNKREAVDYVNITWADWHTNGGLYDGNGFSQVTRARCRATWGDTPASLEADKKIATIQAEQDKQHAETRAKLDLQRSAANAASDMLAALHWAREVFIINAVDNADCLAAINAAIAKAEGK